MDVHCVDVDVDEKTNLIVVVVDAMECVDVAENNDNYRCFGRMGLKIVDCGADD